MNLEANKIKNTQLLMDQFGRRLAARLDVASSLLPHDINERLRVARLQALKARKSNVWETKTAVSLQLQGNSASLSFDFMQGDIWNKFASFLPLVALLVGVFVLFDFHDNKITSELAEVDSRLLLDDLPPTAYTDPGFLKFLQNSSASALNRLTDNAAEGEERSSDTQESGSNFGETNSSR